MPIATILGRMMSNLNWLYPESYLNLSPLGLARSRDKLKPLYFLYCSTYGHQTWQSGDLT